MQLSRLMLSAMLTLTMLLSACGLTEFEEDIDTEFTVPKPARLTAQPYLKTKNFKFDNDPADAEYAKFKKAYIEVVAPTGHDLTVMDSINVYADVDGELTLLATADEFMSGQRYRRMQIAMRGDLRHLTEDRRISLVFEVVPSQWHLSGWPAAGITVRSGVTLLISADIF